MKTKLLLIFIFIGFCALTTAQNIQEENIQVVKKELLLNQADVVSVIPSNSSKIMSGKLLRNVSIKTKEYQENLAQSSNPDIVSVPKEVVAIYLDEYPSSAQLAELESANIKCFTESWIPPLPNHPRGFFLAEMPVNQLNSALSLDFVKKLETAEYENYPQNNYAAAGIGSYDLWLSGYDGSGVKVAILDSGVDTSYAGTELPATFDKRDYSAYPDPSDPDVANITSGHGTHVTGSVLGRGFYSTGRIDDNNGTGSFSGSAPGADLCFLKIGGDASSSASSAAMQAAMMAAVNVYNADILSMSYGGWYAHHDGSSTTEQVVDWVYSQGKPFFLSAGNKGGDDEHYSGTVAAGSSTGFIAVTAPSGGTLTFNLVWYDGLAIDNDLTLEYYDGSQTPLTDVTLYTTTESDRGTESQYSLYNYTVAAGTYYLKVVNNSANEQDFHIYFDNYGYGYTTFDNPDPMYTIGQPSSADHGFAVGAYVSRNIWYPTGGGGYWYGNATTEIIAPFSSRGPRVNGGVTKPNITAPGSAIISLRDQDVYTSVSSGWIDDDGTIGVGDAHYYVMQGTSMSTPITAGAAALLLEKVPTATVDNIYTAITNTGATNSNTGTLPNDTWGNGILDVSAASNSGLLPVELVSFSASVKDGSVELNWSTATEIENYGFAVERKNENKFEEIGFVAGAGNSNSEMTYSFVDANLSGQKVVYRLKQIDIDGQSKYSDEIEVTIVKPGKYALEQNYPNPFNPTTNIKFSIPEKSNISLNVYNALGQLVTTLINKEMEAGQHTINFNASNLSTGVYIYKLETEKGTVAVKKMLLMK